MIDILTVNKVVNFFVTSAYLGLIPYAPGTFGSLLAIGLFFILSTPFSYYLALILLILFGIILSDYATKHIFKVDDSPKIVIDETAGCLLSMIIIDKEDSIWYIVLAFLLFRLFDILKPPPINLLERIKGGLGIMLDDIMAALYTILVLYCIKLYFTL